MTITSRAGMLGLLVSLTVLSAPQGQAAGSPPAFAGPDGTIEQRLSRIAAALRQRQGVIDDPASPSGDQQLAAGFANGRYGGAVRGPGGGGFVNGHPYYGGGSRGFVNGGGGFVNGAYGGGGFVNAVPRGGVFRNW
ncbi:rSAM-associated Gly-rich repeat protein [Synechococcus sp. CS-1325]|uniref:GrrA/OscA1 family cyclophane-containing rSAM-modified RiPP n=1 Tax=Synechococcus sp. CS-1325 TaxID=2847979 RepID=UPI000DB3B054|nr:GrrA/OscA1 family cyclophane-containing rSAM-modified RiPP [Synechococcus sp. CS-1325]MCT0200344.1 rSAM-associated Gly-rich repeat protein [Synechococcus sp. CS-1325]PZU99675.1 MAG: rSAM-associated Gly-rich repeat protein [Cyanobium sp.]